LWQINNDKKSWRILFSGFHNFDEPFSWSCCQRHSGAKDS